MCAQQSPSTPTFLLQKASLGLVPGMELCLPGTEQLWGLSHLLWGWARGLEPSREVSRALLVPQPIFVRSVKLYNNGDFRSSAADMEQALAEYYKAYEDCLAGCEGAYELQEFKDFYPAIAGRWALDGGGGVMRGNG